MLIALTTYKRLDLYISLICKWQKNASVYEF